MILHGSHEDDFYYVADRKKDMIISGGENIYPAEVEDVFYTNPKIFEAAVIGIYDDQWGESVMAVVVPRPGVKLTSKKVIKFCKGKIAP